MTAPLLARDYPGKVEIVGQARADVRDALHGHPLADAAVLVVSELGTNAILHSQSGLPGGTWRLAIVPLDGKGLRLAVTDEGGGAWRRRSLDGLGQGMKIVHALCRSVRVSKLPGVPGRRVSAVITPWT